MAIINSIRRRSGLAVLVIALAIAAFILTDLFGKMLQGGGPESMTVGHIQGERVSYQGFNNRVSFVEAQYQRQGYPINDQTRNSIREQVWGDFIFEKAYQPQFEELGITVTPQEIKEILQGDSLMRDSQSQVIQQLTRTFKDSTGKYSPQMAGSYWTNIPAPQRNQLREGIRKDRLQKKYTSLLQFSTYITKAEAKRDYTNKNTKGDFKFLYVPYSSVADSTVKVTDAELEAYMRDHADEYKSQETRSLEYYALSIDPSPEDSTKFANLIRQTAKDFAKAENDSAFAVINSDDPPNMNFQDPTKLPKEIWETVPTLTKGAVVGPLNNKNTYTIYKISDTKADTANYYANVSNLLIKADSTMKQSEQDSARRKAEGILKKLLDNPGDFENQANTYNTDGTKGKGGALGWSNLKTFVKPFSEAIKGTDKIGVIPKVVKSAYGYHIIKVVHPSTNKLYKVATIKKTLLPGKSTIDEAFKTTDKLVNNSKTLEELRANAAKNPKLIKNTAPKLQPSATNLGSYQGAREIIRWAFKDETKVGEIFKPVELSDQNVYIIAALTGATEKDELSVEANREALTNKVRQEKKKAQILEKLKAAKGANLESIAKSYGSLAQVKTMNNASYDNSSIQGAGFNPLAVGYAFGTTKGAVSKPVGDQTGVFMFEVTKVTPAGEIKDYSKQQKELLTRAQSLARFYIDQAVRELSDIEDQRYKFY
ncbi:peptidylprolyl isomerase [Microscilla marina]|uniref:peptidylprolyl isomerase n=1 Tax=Microscilla marina TaxID=1027 RepID=UPI0005D470D9|nr:peptidylprolyl isomerase [Microscilla marina]